MTAEMVRREVALVSHTGRRFGRWASLLPIVGVLAVAGCGAPQFRYATDSSANTYFKVPHQWHKIHDLSLAVELQRGGYTAGGLPWEVSYDAGIMPSVQHVVSASASKPVAQALVAPVTRAASNAMSYNLLRNLILPVSSANRHLAAQHGFPLTGFKLYRDSIIAPGKGVHGVREIFSYAYPDGHTDTFDQVALTNSDATMVYLLLVHCLSTCYSNNFNQIDTVMTSFTVRSP
jgi:hypothetical protein